MQLPAWPTPVFYYLLYAVVLVGPWVAALRLRPVPEFADFPAPREKWALLLTVLLLPPASYLTAKSGYILLIVGPIFTVSLSVLLTAIAGRRPFLYALIVSLLHLMGFLLWIRTLNGSVDLASYYGLFIFLGCFVAPVCVFGFIAGTFLFLLWRSETSTDAAR